MQYPTARAALANARTAFLMVATCAMTQVTIAAEPVAPAMSPMTAESHAMLMGSNEVPPVDTKAFAMSTIAIGSDMTVQGAVETKVIEGTAAHIHLGAVGTNGPPIITLVKSSATLWSVPAGSLLTKAQYDSYLSGNLYINVHSAEHPSGAIRLQLKP
jgi:hypothetical protein